MLVISSMNKSTIIDSFITQFSKNYYIIKLTIINTGSKFEQGEILIDYGIYLSVVLQF